VQSHSNGGAFCACRFEKPAELFELMFPGLAGRGDGMPSASSKQQKLFRLLVAASDTVLLPRGFPQLATDARPPRVCFKFCPFGGVSTALLTDPPIEFRHEKSARARNSDYA